MASSYSEFKIQLMTTGENDGTWGDITNQNFLAFQQMITGDAAVTFAGADVVLTLVDTNALQTARALRIVAAGNTGGAPRNLIVPNNHKQYIFYNGCADVVTIKTAAGTGVPVPPGRTATVYCDGASVTDATTFGYGDYLNNTQVGAPWFASIGGGLTYRTATGGQRWSAQLNTAEGAGNAGNDYTIYRYDNAGALLAPALTFFRSNGYAAFGGDVAAANVWCSGRVGIDGDIVNHGPIYFASPGGTRNAISGADAVEHGGNSDSNFNIHQYADDGSYLRTALTITRSDGTASFSGIVQTPNWFTGLGFRTGNGQISLVSDANSSALTMRNDGSYFQYRYDGQGFMWVSQNVAAAQLLPDGTFWATKDINTTATMSCATLWVAGIQNRGTHNFNNAANNAPRVVMGVTGSEAAGNAGNDLFINTYDNNSNYIASPIYLIRASSTLQLQGVCEMQSLKASSGGWFSGTCAFKLLGNEPSIAFNYQNLGAKAVIGQIGGAQGTLYMAQGNGTPGAISFNVVTGAITGVNVYQTSDSRLKYDIAPLDSGLDTLTALQPFTYRQVANIEAIGDDAKSNLSAGVMAQDLIGTPLERLVVAPHDDGMGGETFYKFNYQGLTAWFIAAFKDVKNRLESTEAALADLLARVTALENA